MSLSELGITESFIYEQLSLRFGDVKDVYTGSKPQPITTLQHYCKLHGLSEITNMMIMSSDVDYAVPYLKDKIDNKIKIDLYGKVRNDVDISDQSNLVIHNTNEVLSEHINLIYGKGTEHAFVWHEPYHVRDENEDYFGFEDEEPDSNLGHRLRPRLYEIKTQKQLDDILDTFNNL